MEPTTKTEQKTNNVAWHVVVCFIITILISIQQRERYQVHVHLRCSCKTDPSTSLQCFFHYLLLCYRVMRHEFGIPGTHKYEYSTVYSIRVRTIHHIPMCQATERFKEKVSEIVLWVIAGLERQRHSQFESSTHLRTSKIQNTMRSIIIPDNPS